MRRAEISAWAYRVLEQLAGGGPLEDAHVELKADWIDSVKAARRIAGLANAARGDPALWLVGIDEKTSQVVGAEPVAFADWWEQVRVCFVDTVPAPTDVVVEIDDTTVVAVSFDTEEVPYVIRNPNHGRVKGDSAELEVPWREGTAVHSARRRDLLRLLAPLVRRPVVDVLDARMTATARSADAEGPAVHWELDVKAYVTVSVGAEVVVPDHRCRAAIIADDSESLRFTSVSVESAWDRPRTQSRLHQEMSGGPSWLRWDLPDADFIVRTGDQAVVNGPGGVRIHGTAESDLPIPLPKGGSVVATIELVPNFLEPIVLSVPLGVESWGRDDRDLASWKLA